MSHQKPCLHGKWQAVNGIFRCVKCGEDYVPNPNGPHDNAPKPPEAPKVEEYYCGCEPGTYCDNHNPAPAPEPKQGCEEPIDYAMADREAKCWTGDPTHHRELGRAYLALRAEVERLKKLHSDHCSNPICEGPRS